MTASSVLNSAIKDVTIFSRKEVLRLIVFLLWNFIFVISVAEVSRPPFDFLSAVGQIVLFLGFGIAHWIYFIYRRQNPRVIDPYIQRKLVFLLIVLFVSFLSIDFTNVDIYGIGSLIFICYICVFYFCRYIEPVRFDFPTKIDDQERKIELEASIKSTWFVLSKGPLVAASITAYSVFLGYYQSITSFIIIIDFLLVVVSATVVYTWLFFRSSSPPSSSSRKAQMRHFYRHSKSYPVSPGFATTRTIKQKVGMFSGTCLITILRKIREKDVSESLSEWERRYASVLEDLSLLYVKVVYLIPIIYYIVELLPTIYFVLPPPDFAIWGTSLLFLGSLLLALEPISSLPDIEEMEGARLTAYSHLGVVLLATGTIFQAASQLSDINILTTFERGVFLNLVDVQRLAVIREITQQVAPFLVVPLFLRQVSRFSIAEVDGEKAEQKVVDMGSWRSSLRRQRTISYTRFGSSGQARISRVIKLQDTAVEEDSVESFVVNLEYYNQEKWELVARFEHNVSESVSIDVAQNDLTLLRYHDRSIKHITRHPEEIELDTLPFYCEGFLLNYARVLILDYQGEPSSAALSCDLFSPEDKGRLTVAGANESLTTMEGVAYDLIRRQAQVVAWNTQENSSEVLTW